jgi:tRNA/tmRNA/rRNA uracil-C5-methylase (TrmA/RlmC/RlmD family)
MLIKKYLIMPNTLIRDVSYLDDNSSASYTHSLIKYKHDFLLFKSECHFGNAISLFKSIRKKMYENYYGTEKHPENPFRNCKSPKEIFNLSRNIKFDLKMKLSRIGFILLRNGEISVQHKNASILQNNINIQAINKEFIKKHETSLIMNRSNSEENKFYKYDYFMSVEMYEGIISTNSYIQKGISIKALGDKKVYTYYGVFNPTRQDYLELFDEYIRENIRDLKQNSKNCADLGCGTGILSLILSQNGIPRIYALDKIENAILAAKNNSQSMGYFDNIRVINFDVTENYRISENKSINETQNKYISLLQSKE